MALTAEQIRASFEAKKKLLSAPVLADPIADNRESSRRETPAHDWGVRESMSSESGKPKDGRSSRDADSDSRGAQKSLSDEKESSTVTSSGPEKNQSLPSVQDQSTTGATEVSPVPRSLDEDVEKDSPDDCGTTQTVEREELRKGVPEARETQGPPVRVLRGKESSNAPSRLPKTSSRGVAVQTPPSAGPSSVPQAPEIELAVLASLYQYPATCFPIFNEHARPDFFFSPVNQSFFFLLSDYFNEHGQADPQAFLQSLIDSGQLEKHGGSFFLSQLLSATSPPSALEYHLDILRDKFVQRSLYQSAAELARKTMELPQGDLWSLISEHEESIRSLRALAADSMEGVENFSYDDLVAFDPLKDDSVLLGARRWLGKGYTCLWAGGSGYGKSTLEMQAALYWATGTPLFGIKPVRPLKSLILQAENDLGDTGEQLQGVIAGITATGDISLNGEVERMIVVNRLIGCTGDTFLARLSALLKIHRPDLVWIDPLFAFAGCDLIDTQAVSNFLRNGLIPIVVEAQVCAHVIHHVSKPARDNDQKKDWSTFDYQYLGFGSSEIQNAFRAVNIILPVSNDPGTFHLILSKRGDRAGALDLNRESTRDIYLAHGKEGSILWTQVEPPDSEGGKSHRPKAFKLADLLGEMSITEPLKTSALCKHACVETGMSRATFYRLFNEAKNAQKIKVNNDGWILS